MIPSSLPALLGLVALLLIVARIETRIHPAWKARTLAVLTAATLAAATAIVALTVVTFYAQILPAAANGPLALLAGHGLVVPPLLGVGLSLVVLWSGWRAVRYWRTSRRETLASPEAGVVESPRAFAVAVPEGGGRIVVSSALLSLLSGDELRAVYLHEHAHLEKRHHHYVRLTGLLVALFPLFAPVHSAMRLSVERWADEEAATAVGDRTVVAKSLAKVALANAAPSGSLGFADFHTTRRVERLLGVQASPRRSEGRAIFGVTGGLAGYFSGGPLQVHHLLALIAL